MRKLNLILAMLMLTLTALPSRAEWYNEFTFIVGDGVCTPVTVRYAGQSYTVYSSHTITFTGSTSTPSATDCNGNALRYEADYATSSRDSDTYHYNTYTFYNKTSYGSSSGSNPGSYSSGNSTYHNGSDSRWSETGRKLGDFIVSHGMNEDSPAYPGLHLLTGISKGYGELARLRIAAGGFSIYTGIGKDWIFNGDNKDKLSWHAGLGGYVGFGDPDFRSSDLSFGLTVAENTAWEKLSLTFDMDYTHWFGHWRRVGAFAGAGIGWGQVKNLGNEGEHTCCAWNLEIGVVFRLCNF